MRHLLLAFTTFTFLACAGGPQKSRNPSSDQSVSGTTVETVVVSLSSSNCVVVDSPWGTTGEDVDFEKAWLFQCSTDLTTVAKPLLDNGYKYADHLNHRNYSGHFIQNGVST